MPKFDQKTGIFTFIGSMRDADFNYFSFVVDPQNRF
jgi:hypothetical protein